MSLKNIDENIPSNAVFVLDDDQGWISLLRHSGEEVDIVNAARVSFGKFRDEMNEKDEALLKFLIEEEHFAPLEHITFTFLVHCPLFVRSHWHRHRTFSYNEISRRYTEVGLSFYTPKKFRIQSTDNKQASEDDKCLDPELSATISKSIKETNESLLKSYYDLLKAGVCREQARGILPQNMMTTYYATVNFRNLLHFLKLRMNKHAQYEIRQYANAIYNIIKPLYPHVMEAFDKGLIK